jgi:transposase
MIRLTLSSTDHEAIAEALDDPTIAERSQKKLLALRMHEMNVPHGTIATILNVSDDTITNYLKKFQEEGLSGLLENRYYQPVSQVDPYLDTIRESLEKDPVATAKEAAERIRKLTGIELSESQARRVMKGMGMQCRKTAGVPGKADPQLQLDFLAHELLPRLEEARKGERRVYFVDATHFVLGGFLGMIWCFQRLFIRTASGRQRYNVLGAVDTRDQEMVTLGTTESINAQTLCRLLEMLHERHPEERITLVMDNARYQYNGTVWHLAESLGIELLYLPAYSPNLNLIERVWKLVKSKCLRNKYYEDFQTFKGAINEFLNSLNGKNNNLVKSLLTENFHIPTIPKT